MLSIIVTVLVATAIQQAVIARMFASVHQELDSIHAAIDNRNRQDGPVEAQRTALRAVAEKAVTARAQQIW